MAVAVSSVLGLRAPHDSSGRFRRVPLKVFSFLHCFTTDMLSHGGGCCRRLYPVVSVGQLLQRGRRSGVAVAAMGTAQLCCRHVRVLVGPWEAELVGLVGRDRSMVGLTKMTPTLGWSVGRLVIGELCPWRSAADECCCRHRGSVGFAGSVRSRWRCRRAGRRVL